MYLFVFKAKQVCGVCACVSSRPTNVGPMYLFIFKAKIEVLDACICLYPKSKVWNLCIYFWSQGQQTCSTHVSVCNQCQTSTGPMHLFVFNVNKSMFGCMHLFVCKVEQILGPCIWLHSRSTQCLELCIRLCSM